MWALDALNVLIGALLRDLRFEVENAVGDSAGESEEAKEN